MEKISYLSKKAKIEVFTEWFQGFQKIPEFLEFLDSNSRIRFSDKNWVGITPHIVILAKNGRIMSQIGNRLIKISWNQLIFYSDQSWPKSHLYWTYSWFLKIPVHTSPSHREGMTEWEWKNPVFWIFLLKSLHYIYESCLKGNKSHWIVFLCPKITSM